MVCQKWQNFPHLDSYNFYPVSPTVRILVWHLSYCISEFDGDSPKILFAKPDIKTENNDFKCWPPHPGGNFDSDNFYQNTYWLSQRWCKKFPNWSQYYDQLWQFWYIKSPFHWLIKIMPYWTSPSPYKEHLRSSKTSNVGFVVTQLKLP